MSTLAGTDGCTDIILDFIRGGVPTNPNGEANGNYNAVIGNAHATDDLGKKSLDDIYRLMDHFIAIHRPSTATGGYQIIRRTLRTMQAALELPGSELFTPELQDRLAVRLLVGRGYPAWWRNHMTNEEFAHGISMEWASLPDPARPVPGHPGQFKSHYDGVGANHASTTLAHVYQALDRARVAQPKATPRMTLVRG